MKKHLLVIISLIFMVLSFFTFNDSVISSDNNNDKSSYLFDRQQSDIESIYNIASSNKTVMPELQNSLPSTTIVTKENPTTINKQHSFKTLLFRSATNQQLQHKIFIPTVIERWFNCDSKTPYQFIMHNS